jgi:hypothetical protein
MLSTEILFKIKQKLILKPFQNSLGGKKLKSNQRPIINKKMKYQVFC